MIKLRLAFLLLLLILITFEISNKLLFGVALNKAYLIIFFFITIVLCLNFILRENLNNYIFVGILSSLVGIFLFENYIFFSKNNLGNSIVPKNKGYDERTLFEYLAHEKNRGVDSIIPFRATQKTLITYKKDFFPLSGVSKINTILCNENGFMSKYMSDRYGFNNNDDIWDKIKSKNILLVGDSFTIGCCVNRENNFSSILKSFFPSYEFFNLGYGDSGPLIQLAVIQEYIDLVNPRYILWFYYEGNDQENLIFELRNSILKKYLISDFKQNLYLDQDKIDKILRDIFKKDKNENLAPWKTESKNLSFYLRSVFGLKETKSVINNYFQTYKLSEFSKIINKAKLIASKKNSEIIFIYLPSHQRYSQNKNENFKKKIEVLKIIKNNSIKVIDVKLFFDTLKNPLDLFPFQKPAHYSVDGYKEVSYFIRNNLLKIFQSAN